MVITSFISIWRRIRMQIRIGDFLKKDLGLVSGPSAIHDESILAISNGFLVKVDFYDQSNYFLPA